MHDDRSSLTSANFDQKIKIAPLRLYIDQDALDFLKAFGAFKAPAATLDSANPASSSSSQEPFFRKSIGSGNLAAC